MFLERLYDDGLAQASYLIGCEATGEAMVVDANRDIEAYIARARQRMLRITHVTETHIHADFVSGSRELAEHTGAKLLLSVEGGDDWQYAFTGNARATLLRDGDHFTVGRVRIDVLHTPGHTPEHLAFLVTDLASSDRPLGLLSGDFVFVGDVGRPDLLERAANVANTMTAAAHTLYRSLQRFRALPDHVQLWPGHGAGSACGKSLGAMPQSTVGYEKVANWGVVASDENAFVAEVLAGQPEPPAYFAEMKRMNRDGPPLLGALPHPRQIDGNQLAVLLDRKEIVVDARSSDAFAASHVPGSLHIPLGGSFATWAGWLLPYDRDVHLIVGDVSDADRAARDLALIGIDRVAGWFAPAALQAWSASAGQTLERVALVTAIELAPRLRSGDVTLVDVRSRSEWDGGHLPGAVHVPAGHLAARLPELSRERPIVVQCQGGTRSVIGASVLLRLGVRDVLSLRGGADEWVREGLPLADD